MNVSFEIQLDEHDKAEIDEVLHRIKVGDGYYNWQEEPDKIEVLRKLTGGRGASEVFEVSVTTGQQRVLKVIKIGSYNDLKTEIQGYKSVIKPNAYFTPIESATGRLLGEGKSREWQEDRSEAIVYAHAEDWFGKGKLETFEEIARSAIKSGGSTLETAIGLLERLFTGISQRLYVNPRFLPCGFWNLRLGPDGVIEVEEFDQKRQLLKLGAPSNKHLSEARLYPVEISATENWKGGTVKLGDVVYIDDLNVEWWGNHLMGIKKSHNLRFEIVAFKNKNILDVATKLMTDSSFSIYGKIKSIRAGTHKNRLLSSLNELKVENGLIIGPGATAPDPFVRLPDVLKNLQSGRITSLVHGDLNPRNILVIEHINPCLIDYAHTREDEPILSDFVRLEGCLARDVLPDNLSWKQHVRLQRLLAASFRLSDETIEKFTQLLAQDRVELASAFRLFYTIRKESKEVYSEPARNQWYQDYLEQLFLFAHLTLKWEDQTPQALCATAAMAGAALEAISKEEVYRWWNLEDLQGDGSEIIKFLKSTPKLSLSEMANFARGIDFWKKGKRDSLPLSKYDHIMNEYWRESAINTDLDAEVGRPLISEVEELRSEFVRSAFHNEANKSIVDLQKYHETFISLQAYIDLKGRISTAQDQELHSSFIKVLQEDSLLAEQERLRFGEMEGNAINLISKQPEAVLIGDAGSGKSTVAREWEFLLAELIIGRNEDILSRYNLDKK
jgi:hypothetical protein